MSSAPETAESYDRANYSLAKKKTSVREKIKLPTKKEKAEAGAATKKSTTEKRRFHLPAIPRKFAIASGVIVLVLAIAIGVLSWNQWLRYDDTADIQGTWVADGTQQVITITDSEMKWTDSVSYGYSLDTFNKTITFNFQQYTGQGSYAFSEDRNAVSITEVDADSGEDVTTTLVRQS